MITKNEIAVRFIPRKQTEYIQTAEARCAVHFAQQFNPATPRVREVVEEHLKSEFIRRIYGEVLAAAKEVRHAVYCIRTADVAQAEAAIEKLFAAIPRP